MNIQKIINDEQYENANGEIIENKIKWKESTEVGKEWQKKEKWSLIN